VRKEILIRVLRIIAVSKKKLEEVEKADEVKSMKRALEFASVNDIESL